MKFNIILHYYFVTAIIIVHRPTIILKSINQKVKFLIQENDKYLRFLTLILTEEFSIYIINIKYAWFANEGKLLYILQISSEGEFKFYSNKKILKTIF